MADNILERLSANNMFNLRGVVAVVTGGSSVSLPFLAVLAVSNRYLQGIGLAISLTLVSNGARVYIIDINQARLEQ